MAIVGWAHSPFGRLDDADVESLIARVAGGAIADAGISPLDIDGVFIGHFNGGLSSQGFPSSLAANSVPELRLKPAVRVENACASGSAAVYTARDFIAARRGRFALVIGAEKMTDTPASKVGSCLMTAAYRKESEDNTTGFAGIFGQIAARYFAQYGNQSDALARIAAKNHRNGVDNPFAQIRRDLGFEFCRNPSEKNPFVAPPLKRTDCSLISDGSAALVLADPCEVSAFRRAVGFRAAVHVNDLLPISQRDPTWFTGAAEAWARALSQARMRLDDVSLVETHDCFTIAELIEYEAMGLTPRGQGARAIQEGWTCADGRLPINRSGGLKSKGHPIGATGVSMHILAAMQLTGEAGEMQLARTDSAGVFNMGGAAVANYVSLLERWR